jgi:predicted TPR repeat methyltransferase
MQSNSPDPVGAALRAIEADVRGGRLNEAAAALDALAARAPADFRIFVAGAAFARATRNVDLEIESLRRAAALAPGNRLVHAELAKSLSRAGRHDEAKSAATQLVELVPGDLPALEIAVAVSDAAGDLAGTRRNLESALALRPGDMSIVRALARCLTRLKLHDEAVVQWRAALAADPDDLLALQWLASSLIELGQRQEALAVLGRVQALAPESPGLEFHLALARGETPAHAPNAMTRELFDDYASRFDKELVGGLKYAVPRRVAAMIRAWVPGLRCDILDLGCGTGLLGVYLGPCQGAFIGVDLSPRMLERAAEHRIYSELREGDLLDELRAARASYDFIVANDVFIYVGDLSEVIPAAFAALRGGGRLVFSCETAQASEGDLALRPSKRYAHSAASVQALCRAAGFTDCTIEPLVLRYDKREPIDGFIATATRT